MRLLIYEPSYRRLQSEIAAHGDAVEVLIMDKDGGITLRGEAVAAADANPDAGWVNSDLFFGTAFGAYLKALLGAPNLGWVQSGAAGVDYPVFRQIIERGIAFTTSHGQAVGIAEYVIAGVMDALQNGPERRAAQAGRSWSRVDFREVGGTHWLVVGFGAIGQGVAVRAGALGATVTGVRRSGSPHPAAQAMVRLADLPQHVPTADVVVLCCPLTDETRHVADAALFSAMKPDAILVNVGRGALVDEAALLEALDRGTPQRAILDVFETEPLPDDSAFWAHPRVAMTAHTSGATRGQETRNDATFLENLQRRLAGGPLRHLVSRDTMD